VELFEQIRREYEFGIGTIVGVAKKLGVHRRMVREAIGSALPKPRKKPDRLRWKLKTAVEFVDAILEADRKAPRKQRHTAHRIWARMQQERPECKIAERTVREYVHDRKIALGLNVFLEAHELAFAYFGGVFRKLRYDNLTAAVKKILRGHRREETARFVAFRSHWRFEAEFCTPAEPHEKGGIEGEAGYFRRNHWVPVPEAADLVDMNRQLLNACQQDERRMIAGREQTVGSGMLIEREHLLPLAAEGADMAQTSFPTVNGLGCVKVLTNTYSVPLPAGTQVQAKAYASTIELWHSGHCMARHERCYQRQQQVLDLEHYLDVLYRKPGALAGSKPLEQKRQAGLWPPSFDRIWEALMERHGKQSGTRQMIDLLKLSQKHGQTKLQAAIESALSSSYYDSAAVQHLLNAENLRHTVCEAIDVGALERYARPLPAMLEYDQLLTTAGGR
jgi:hypothetical protein